MAPYLKLIHSPLGGRDGRGVNLELVRLPDEGGGRLEGSDVGPMPELRLGVAADHLVMLLLVVVVLMLFFRVVCC